MKEFILKSKQTASNKNFVKVWNDIESYVSKEQMDTLVQDAVEEVRAVTRGKRVAYGWSGGKDSIALQVVMELAGIDNSIMATAKELEFPIFLEWAKQNAPTGLKIVDNEKLTLKFLRENKRMLFNERKDNSLWYQQIQWRATDIFYKRESLDILVLGRRWQDGNYTGRGKGSNIYTNQKGITRYSPIASWKHEHVLAAIHYYKNRSLPSIYHTEDGWVNGTGVWASRNRREDINDNWREIYQIDKSIVLKASKELESARTFLHNIN